MAMRPPPKPVNKPVVKPAPTPTKRPVDTVFNSDGTKYVPGTKPTAPSPTLVKPMAPTTVTPATPTRMPADYGIVPPAAKIARERAAGMNTGMGTGMKKGGSVSASKRADGCAKRGKTKGRMV